MGVMRVAAAPLVEEGAVRVAWLVARAVLLVAVRVEAARAAASEAAREAARAAAARAAARAQGTRPE